MTPINPKENTTSNEHRDSSINDDWFKLIKWLLSHHFQISPSTKIIWSSLSMRLGPTQFVSPTDSPSTIFLAIRPAPFQWFLKQWLPLPRSKSADAVAEWRFGPVVPPPSAERVAPAQTARCRGPDNSGLLRAAVESQEAPRPTLFSLGIYITQI